MIHAGNDLVKSWDWVISLHHPSALVYTKQGEGGWGVQQWKKQQGGSLIPSTVAASMAVESLHPYLGHWPGLTPCLTQVAQPHLWMWTAHKLCCVFQAATAWWGATIHKETPAEHTAGHCGDILINRRHSPTEESLPWWKKTKTQVTKQQKLLLNLLSLFWHSLACLTGLLDMCNDHLEPASLGAHLPLVVYLHLTTATHSASCYTKHKNKQIIQ